MRSHEVKAASNPRKSISDFLDDAAGMLRATVEHVSQTAIQDEELGLIYACRLKISRFRIHPTDAARATGAAAETERKTGGIVMPMDANLGGAAAPEGARAARARSEAAKIEGARDEGARDEGLRLDPARLQSGMSVTAEIKTGQRPVIDFLLSPLARRVSEAGRER